MKEPAMKKTLGTYFSQYFKMPHLYRDDLEAIEKTVRKELKPDKFILACGGFEFETVEDLASDMKTTSVLVIYTHNPCVRLKFARSWAELYSGNVNEGIADAVQKIAMIVSKGERPWLWRFCKLSAWLAPLIGFGSLTITLGLIMLEAISPRSLYLASWLLMTVSIWWAVGHRGSLNNFSRIDLQRTRGRARGAALYRERLVTLAWGFLFSGASLWLLAKFLGRV
jgi:hypothetical protein